MLQNLSSAAVVIGALRVKLFEYIHMVEKLAALYVIVIPWVVRLYVEIIHEL